MEKGRGSGEWLRKNDQDIKGQEMGVGSWLYLQDCGLGNAPV